jgi:nitrite reductase (NO-forming)
MASAITNQTLSRRVAALRIAFGVIWAVDASFKWQPAFASGFMDQITSAADSQAGWIQPWFHAWSQLLSSNPQLFAHGVATAESLIAICLLFGFGRRTVYIAGAVFSLLIWSVAEGFGGPYSNTSTDIGAGIIYAVVFLALYGLDQLATPATWSIDGIITAKLPWWKRVSNP